MFESPHSVFSLLPSGRPPRPRPPLSAEHPRVFLPRAQRTVRVGRWPIPAPAALRHPTAPHPEPARHGSGGEFGPPGSGGVLIGYARCSTDKQDLAAQRHTLRQLGVSDDRVYLDHGITGRNRRLFFNILATFAEFEVDLLRMRTREGMAIAREGQAQRQPAQAQRPPARPRSAARSGRRAHDRGVG